MVLLLPTLPSASRSPGVCAASRKLTDCPMPSWQTVQPIRSIGCGESPPRLMDRFGCIVDGLRVALEALLVNHQVASIHADPYKGRAIEGHVVDVAQQDRAAETLKVGAMK